MTVRSDGDSYGYFDDDTFHLTHDAGFFSMCSTTLFELSRARSETKRIEARNSFTHFGRMSRENPWDLYFHQPRLDVPAPFSDRNPFARRLRHHSDYSTLPLKRVRGHLARYFSPSETVIREESDLLARYNINPAQTISVCFRGTDKSTEIALENPQVYLEAARTTMKKHPRTRVLVQTDQAQVRDFLMEEIGERAFFIEEMPVTYSSQAIHDVISPEAQISFGQTLLASVLIMSKTRHLITHTGNMALWTILYRGNLRNVTQLGFEKPVSQGFR